MGVNLFMEDELGKKLADVLDPQGFVGCIVSLAGGDSTTCLRFIDLYGDTVFNQIQIPILIGELEAARDLVTDDSVDKLTQGALDSARKAQLGPAVIHGIESSNRNLRASDIRSHLERIIDLARR